MQDLIIIGAGGAGKQTYGVIKAINKVSMQWNILGFSGSKNIGADIMDGYRNIGTPLEIAEKYRDVAIVIAEGFPGQRKEMKELFKGTGFSFPNIIHPSVEIDEELVEMGEGNIVMAFTNIDVLVKMGSFNFINTHCLIAHDGMVGDFCVINPGAMVCGGVILEDEVMIGANATIHQGMKVGYRTVLALGASLFMNAKPETTYIGNPAKKYSFGR